MEVLSEQHFRELLKQWRKVEDNIKDKLNELESAEALKMAGEVLWYEYVCCLYGQSFSELL